MAIYYENTPNEYTNPCADIKRHFDARFLPRTSEGEKMKTYLGLVVQTPTDSEIAKGGTPKVVLAMDVYIAANEDSVKMQMMQKLDDKVDFDRLLFKICNPFR